MFKNYDVYIQGILFSPTKEWTQSISYNIDEPGVKENKKDTETEVSHDLINMWALKHTQI